MRDGKVGAGQSCCCGCAPCPDLQSLCVAATLTDYNGDVFTADEGDVFWFGGTGYLSFGSYTLTISCAVAGSSGGISVNALWNDFLEECGGQCTSAGGGADIPCSAAADWYATNVEFAILFDEPFCDCYPVMGNVSVTFSDPPC